MTSTSIEKLYQYTTSEISDALDSLRIEGCLPGIRSFCAGYKIAGPVFTVEYVDYEKQPEGFQQAGNYIDEVPEGSIVLIDNQGRTDCTVWGEILSQVALLKGIEGTVIHGAARDIRHIKDLQYPLFAKEIYMRSGKNRVKKRAHQTVLKIGDVHVFPGDFLVADDCGAVVIPAQKLGEVLERAENIKKTEHSILMAFKRGQPLASARAAFHYDQPWIAQ